MSNDARWLLEELIPHEHPMILIDDITVLDNSELFSTVRISEDCLYYERSKGVPTYVGIEYVAQTVAASFGMKSKLAGKVVSPGYLLGTRHYHAREPYFVLGSLLTIRITPDFESAQMAIYNGRIENDTGEIVVETSITVYSGQVAE